MPMQDDVIVIIRSTHERTESWCYDIIAREVPEGQITIIHEIPFSKAVNRTFSIGFNSNKKWTLAVDADILLKKNAIREMIANAEKKPAHTFIYQGCVLDKLFNGVRPGGPHLYRSSLLQPAMDLIPAESENLRPESFTYNKMAESGFHFYQEGIIYGIHDYEQYLKDIYRKSFIHARKHDQHSGRFLKEWANNPDEDYDVAIKAFFDGLTFKGKVSADVLFFEKLLEGKVNDLFLKHEKKPLDKINDAYVSERIKIFLDGFTDLSFLHKHTKTTFKGKHSVSKPLWHLGKLTEALGRRLIEMSGINLKNH